jgi:acyl-CoA synthetase (AMP-forming)/AMP-acid ligase II
MALVIFCVLNTDARADLTADFETEKRTGYEADTCPTAGAGKQMERLRNELKQMVIAEMGKPLSPKEIFFVSDLPKTRNAKVMRRMIRAAYLGQEPGDTSSLVNPEAVEEIKRAK